MGVAGVSVSKSTTIETARDLSSEAIPSDDSLSLVSRQAASSAHAHNGPPISGPRGLLCLDGSTFEQIL